MDFNRDFEEDSNFIFIMGLLSLISYIIFLLVSNGLYNPLFRSRFWLTVDAWQSNDHIVFNAYLPSCVRFSTTVTSDNLHLEGECAPYLPAFSELNMNTTQLQKQFGNIQQIIASPDGTRLALVTRTVRNKPPLRDQNLYVVETSTGQIINEVEGTELLRQNNIHILFFTTTIAYMEKVAFLLLFLLVSCSVWRISRDKARIWKAVLPIIFVLFVLTSCYIVSVILYGLKWSSS